MGPSKVKRRVSGLFEFFPGMKEDHTPSLHLNIASFNKDLGVPNVVPKLVGSHFDRAGGSTKMTDSQGRYQYSMFYINESGYSEVPQGWIACKDYVNDWLFNRANEKEASSFNKFFKYGAYVAVGHNAAFHSSWLMMVKNASAMIYQFLKEVRYNKPDHFKLVAVIPNKNMSLWHIDRELLYFPPLLSGSLAIMRNSGAYRGETIVDYFTKYGVGAAASEENSKFNNIAKFVTLFSKTENIHDIFGDGKMFHASHCWNQKIGNSYSIHGGFGINSFASYPDILNIYKNEVVKLTKPSLVSA